MNSTIISKIIPIITISLIILSCIGSVAAVGLLASPGGFQVKFTGGPTTYSGTVIVENIGNEPLNVLIIPKRMQKDSVNLIFSDTGIATWISANPTNFTLAPKEKKDVTFTVNVPANINYYDAVGALIIQGYPQKQENTGNQNLPNLQVQQVPELIVPIAIGLPGPIIESLQILEHKAPAVLLSFMPGQFEYLLNNNGTVYANMTGNIEIDGLISKHSVPIEAGIYPGDNYTYVTKWEPDFFDFGIYNAKTNMNYGRYQATQTLQTSSTLLVIPVWLIIILVIAILIWVIRKKEIKSPIKIKIEKKK
jgi:hypothetical protein